jgi:hypothetical protein
LFQRAGITSARKRVKLATKHRLLTNQAFTAGHTRSSCALSALIEHNSEHKSDGWAASLGWRCSTELCALQLRWRQET